MRNLNTDFKRVFRLHKERSFLHDVYDLSLNE